MTSLATRPTLLNDALAALSAMLGARLSTAAAVREQHGTDISHLAPAPPDAVVFAQSTQEVAAVVKICARFGVPVIPFGTGTSLEGHIIATEGGVSIDLNAMNRVLAVNTEDLDVVVQPGVTRK